MNQNFPQEQRGPYGPSPMPSFNSFLPGNYVEDFIQAMHQAGVRVNENIIGDGSIHRFSTDNKRHKDGWYVFYGLAGAFGDWNQDIHKKWSLKNADVPGLDKEQLFGQLEKAQRIADEERKRKHEEMARAALKKWESFSEKGDSPYLINKKVEPFEIRFSHN